MTIRLRMFGSLRRHAPRDVAAARTFEYEVPEGTTALQLIMKLGIPYGGEEGQMVVAVNDIEVSHETMLQPGDVVSLFEPLAGG